MITKINQVFPAFSHRLSLACADWRITQWISSVLSLCNICISAWTDSFRYNLLTSPALALDISRCRSSWIYYLQFAVCEDWWVVISIGIISGSGSGQQSEDLFQQSEELQNIYT